MKKTVLDSRPQLAACIGECAEVAGYLCEKGSADRNVGNMTFNVTVLLYNDLRLRPAL